MTKIHSLKRKSENGKQTDTKRSNKSENQKPAQKSLDDLLVDGLREIYSAETQLLAAMPEIAEACHSRDLEDAVKHHMDETRRHIERLEKVFRRLGIEPTGEETCPAMEGLINEAKKVIADYEESAVRDSALIIGSQKIEHYEIACYGSLCELCDVLGYWNICDLLGRTLDEEEKTDLELTEIAMYVNDEAYEMSEKENEYEEEEAE